MSKLLLQNIEGLIPKSLDDIFRQNRDLAELGLSSLIEIAALEAEIQPGMPVTDVFDDWRFISLRDKLTGRVQVILLGVAQKRGSERITSEVVRIDLRENSIFTRSGSHYGLGTQGIGEPPMRHLILVCAAFHRSKMAELLGVPHFFY
ncbi:MAG: hypothetical protein ACYCTH_13275 [Cellulomonas sp.]